MVNEKSISPLPIKVKAKDILFEVPILTNVSQVEYKLVEIGTKDLLLENKSFECIANSAGICQFRSNTHLKTNKVYRLVSGELSVSEFLTCAVVYYYFVESTFYSNS